MNISITGFITCKGAELYTDCADYYCYNQNTYKFCISDGVSKSFFPKIWSKALSKKFIETPNTDRLQFIREAQSHWQSKIEEIIAKPDAKWYTKADYNKRSPALATFVGLEFHQIDLNWKAWALGDSFLFFVPKNYKVFEKDVIKLSSKQEPFEFDNFPDYYSSIGENHKGKLRNFEGKLEDGTFYLMTDALAEWFLTEKENAITIANSWKDQIEFEDYVATKRKNGNLTDDDSAILIINIEYSSEPKMHFSSSRISVLEDLIQKQELELNQPTLLLPSEFTKKESEVISKQEIKEMKDQTAAISEMGETCQNEEELMDENKKAEEINTLKSDQENNSFTPKKKTLWNFLTGRVVKNPNRKLEKPIKITKEVEIIKDKVLDVPSVSQEEENRLEIKYTENTEKEENISEVVQEGNNSLFEPEKNKGLIESNEKVEERNILEEIASATTKEEPLSENSKLQNEAANRITNKF